VLCHKPRVLAHGAALSVLVLKRLLDDAIISALATQLTRQSNQICAR
jgi:hypothetical protein